MKKNKVSPKVKEASKEFVLTPAKKKIFWAITVSLPILVFLLLEIGLRIFNYGGNLDLFIEGPPGYEEYVRCNPNVARRYFSLQSNVPTPPKQLFLKQKPKNGFRIFVLGESSAAGFPYAANASFPNYLERGLSNTFPDKKIEVINVAMAAICSYTLQDFIDEILEQSPDALLIYTGHNEYYGALGVGSAQSFGNSRWLIRTMLSLQSFKTICLIRDILTWTRSKVLKLVYEGNEVDPSATLMERIVAEQTIPYGSSLYEAGKEQFKENMEIILNKAKEKNVKVFLSELMSNLKDQPPFISIDDKEEYSAKYFFKKAAESESKGEYEKAKQCYTKARDYDALRFRASEDFNSITRDLSQKYSVPVVLTSGYFDKASPNGLVGNNLMLEHLHPNSKGYFLLAKAFYETMRNNKLISDSWAVDGMSREENVGTTGLDSVYASLAVQQLKAGWPFQPKTVPNRFVQNFHPVTKIEEIAFNVFQNRNFSIEVGHMELGKYYEQQGLFTKAFKEYFALVTSIPTEIEFYEKAVTVLIKEKNYDPALDLLFKSLHYKQNSFAYKWIGQIGLIKKDYKLATSYLSKADLNDAQVLFNLSRAYYADNQFEKGDKYYSLLKSIASQSQYYRYLTRMRETIKLTGKFSESN